MEMKVLVMKDGMKHLEVKCRGTPENCSHESFGPGAERFEFFLGKVPAVRPGCCTTSKDPRDYHVIVYTAGILFPPPDGYQITIDEEYW